MTRIKGLAAGLLGAFAFAANAHAADPAGAWPPPMTGGYERPEPQFKELLSGWYFRVDLGYRLNSVGSFDTAAPTINAKYHDAIAGTVGVGFKNQWFRADVTVDRGSPSNISATTATAVTQPQYSSKITPLTLLGNAYIDLGTWSGFTPYVGVGAGVTQLKSAGYIDTSRASGVLGQDGTTRNFTWAAMAGIGFKVKPNWMLDVGYRYLDMGNLPANNMTISAAMPTAAQFNKLTAQEVRVGIRFLFD